MSSVTQIKRCGICNSSSFEGLWQLPKLPLTERFGKYVGLDRLSYYQALSICLQCGHVQLEYQLDPKILYSGKSYSFRTGQSASAVDGAGVFIDFLNKVSNERKFQSLLDVGGNDLYLAKQLAEKAVNRCVIDPICSANDGKLIDGIKVIGRAIEQVKIAEEMEIPDIVVCRHTLEHVSRPYEVLYCLLENTADNCLYVFEVPCLEGLMEGFRLDAVFHQHYHYYSLETFKYLIESLGGEYLDHKFNYQGSCGGSLLVAFTKSKKRNYKNNANIKDRIKKIRSLISDYESFMAVTSRVIKSLPSPVYGYGASLMLATMVYHLKTDFSFFECILDDDISKDGMTYENIPVRIRSVSNAKPDMNACYVITSLENVRPIYRKLHDINARRIIVPHIS